MKAIGYIRVSTEEQSADDKYGIEVQKQAIFDYANRNDFEIVCWLTDTISGAKDNRPELDKILYNPDQLPAHEAVIVFKNDRVARDTKLYFYYFYTLEKRNVNLLPPEYPPHCALRDRPRPVRRAMFFRSCSATNISRER